MDTATPLNPMMTPTFPAVPGELAGTSVWVLQVHKSGRPPVWNGPLPSEEVARAANEKVKEAMGKSPEELKDEGYSEEEIKLFKDILCVVTYKAEVTLTPLDNVPKMLGQRTMGFVLPHREKEDAKEKACGDTEVPA